jgi:hypothetical protein
VKLARGEEDAALLVSGLVFLFGFCGVMSCLWSMIREGGPPPTAERLEFARRMGVASAHVFLAVSRAVWWSLGAAGVASILGLRETAFWIVTAAGAVIGSLESVRHLRNWTHCDPEMNETPGDRP